MDKKINQWVCSQLGAREKYSIPRALYRSNRLSCLYTDLWFKPGSILQQFNARVMGRFHADLINATVIDNNVPFLILKLREKIVARDESLDDFYENWLCAKLKEHKTEPGIFFGYSYSSRKSMKLAKSMGYKTVLGQINPGPAESEIVKEEYRKFQGGVHKPFVPDNQYWDLWREEVSYADQLIVNSKWSYDLLTQEGIPTGKMRIIPLAFEEKLLPSHREFPVAFTRKRPLRLLYLGGLELRKGFHILLETMLRLKHVPVHLEVVGGLKGPQSLLTDLPDNVTYHSAVAPAQVARFYQNSDLFVFPTLSDGFGLTLLEAQAYKLPVITSTHCANVITDNVNGRVLNSIDVMNLIRVIMELAETPDVIRRFSNASVSMADYSISNIGKQLYAI